MTCAELRRLAPDSLLASELEPVEHRVEHAVGPLQLAPRELADSLENGVAVALTLAEDGQHQGRGGCGDEVFTYVHARRQDGIHDGWR